MLSLASEFSIERFLETGTHLGRTTAWASANFSEVVTIEASEELQQAAIEKRGRLSNVRWVLGDTRDVLAPEVERLTGPAIVWLDSHWSGGATYGERDQCPLISEIETLRASPHPHHLFVDDARLFLAPPPPPNDPAQWPVLREVVAALTSGERPLEVFVLGDTFVAVPPEATPAVRRYAQSTADDGVAGGDETPTGIAARLRARLRRRG